jgi:hypothetical protein
MCTAAGTGTGTGRTARGPHPKYPTRFWREGPPSQMKVAAAGVHFGSKLELHEFQIKDAFGKVVRGVLVVIIATAPGHYLEMQ